ncbi:anti-phage defense ZorAB system protein ZorA [Methylicorpusculum oleiharenae]|uniref:anti-phage ZorAB system protein ZorA n=1 Tax=Methylicorpusculum oleiharenae TaxID=1338687 RepID=UPI001357B490|nr:anti-phage ZorAB system protein ZorA [Methylicorpusculum oleiharenae]MCD2453808.1 anti-phage defense ZorAB system protein ZorA [Methylicorpusculum oleiharenae]
MIDQLLNLTGTVQLLFAFLAGLVLFFIFRFLIPGISLLFRLNRAVVTLESIKASANGASIDPNRIAQDVMIHPTLSHLWSEFSETLHSQKEVDNSGQLRTVRWRSTVPAETFFTSQTIVDIHLKTDYFKHSPGIMTGLGIIGTFSGLLHGLEKFKGTISDNPDEVREGLSNLLGGVSEAFIVSAIAILSAMVTTFIEKYLASQCYKRVEDLCQLIDGLYEAGVGEEYLAELLSAAKTSATQTTQLKDALVADLREIMTDLASQHIEAIRQTSTAQVETTTRSGQEIADAITNSLKEPIERMSVAMNNSSDTNGDVVTRALNEALVTFSSKMEDVFGGQMKGMNELLVQTMGAMQTTVGKFDQLAANLDSAGRNTADAMADKVEQALISLEARQQALNTQMGEFVSQIRELVGNSQSETSKKLQETLDLLGTKVSEMVGQLEEQAKNASDSHADKQSELAQHAAMVVSNLGSEVRTTVDGLNESLVGAVTQLENQTRVSSEFHQEQQRNLLLQVDQLLSSLSTQVQTLAGQSTEAVQSMRESVSSMREVTSDTVNKMNYGADTLSSAASNFAKAGDGVTGVLQQTVGITDKMVSTSGALSTAAGAVSAAVNDYQAARDAVARMVAELKLTVENARREASVTESLVSKLEAAANQLEQAKGDVSGFFEEVCAELANAHQEFASSMEATLKKGNSEFHKEMSQSVSYLSSAVKELGDVVEDIPRR